MLLFLLSASFLAGGAEHFVSPTGSDKGPGSREKPWATLQRASEEVGRLKASGRLPKGGMTIWLAGGTYEQSKSLRLGAKTSGEEGKPIVFASLPGEQAHLLGGTRISLASTTPLAPDDPIHSRFPQHTRPHLRRVQLSREAMKGRLSLAAPGTRPGAELYISGVPLRRARWPNVGAPAARTSAPVTETSFALEEEMTARWSTAPGFRVHGLWKHPWADAHASAHVEPGTANIRLSKPPRYGLSAGSPFYVYDLPEELDEPGEYYIEPSSGVAYVWLPPVEPRSELQLSLLAGPLVLMEDAHHVTWRNVVFECSGGELVVIRGGSHNQLVGCTLRGAGGNAISISGTENGVECSTIADCGAGGVVIVGGERANLVPGRNYLRDSIVRRVGRIWWTRKPAVELAGCGNEAFHNLIVDAPHTGIKFSGNNHWIHANEITRVCLQTADAGAIYAGRNWSFRGNRITNNFVHHVQSGLAGGVHGIYLDDTLPGTEVGSNILFAIQDAGIFCGAGRDNHLHNNIIARCGVAHFNGDYPRARINNRPGDPWNVLERMRDNGVDPLSQTWAAAYPELARIPGDWQALLAGTWRNPEGSTFVRNAGWENREWMKEKDDSRSGIFDVYAAIEDNAPAVAPLFTDEAAEDRTHRSQVLVAPLPDFQPIPFAEVGPRNCAHRPRCALKTSAP